MCATYRRHIPPDVAQHGDHRCARSVGPQDTPAERQELDTCCAASANSCGSQPPSGPTSTIASDGSLSFEARHVCDVLSSTWLHEHQPRLACCRLQQRFKQLRLVHRRHDGAAALLDRRDDRALPAILASTLRTAFIGTSVRRLTNGCTAATPSMTASRITRSILSLFSSACASVTATRGSGAASRGSTTSTPTRRDVTEATRASASRPLSIEDRDGIPRASRSTRARCCASSSGRSHLARRRKVWQRRSGARRGLYACYTALQCFSAVRRSESTRSCRHSAAADSARFTSPKTPGSTRKSPSRFLIGRTSTSAICCASLACSPPSTIRTSSRS